MFESLWKKIERNLSGEQARAYTLRINEHARWTEFEEMVRTAEVTAEMMREAGLEEVELIETPADGHTAFGGWVNPEFWHVEDATLEIIAPRVEDSVLAFYRSNPCSLMVYSKPTPPAGITAEVVVIEDSGEDVYKGKDLTGKIVLMKDGGIRESLLAFGRGAVGVISDRMSTDRFIRPAEQMENVTRWHNYAIPPWKTDQKGFGFSLSPRQGKRLRKLLDASSPVVVHVTVRGALRTGPLYVVTGLLPGVEKEEIVLTGHLYEYGADDNASGCGLGIEIVRTIGDLIQAGEIARPQRGLRLLYGMEIRGTNAYLALSEKARRLRGGINLDMVGVEQNEGRVICSVDSPCPAQPCFHHYFVERLLERLRDTYPYFRFRRKREFMMDDNAMCEPMFNAGCPVVWQLPAPHHHTSLDTPALISSTMLELMGTCFGTYCLFLMNAGSQEARWLAQLTYGRVRRDVLSECEELVVEETNGDIQDQASLKERLDFLAAYGAGAITSVDRLVESNEASHRRVREITADLIERFRRFVTEQEMDVAARLRKGGRRIPAAPPPPSQDLIHTARAMIPQKAFPGYLGWEWVQFVSAEKRDAFLGDTGELFGWCAPPWMQMALFWSNGERDVLDIYDRMRASKVGVELEQLIACIRGLAQEGFVTLGG
jgi:hypothetical protein